MKCILTKMIDSCIETGFGYRNCQFIGLGFGFEIKLLIGSGFEKPKSVHLNNLLFIAQSNVHISDFSLYLFLCIGEARGPRGQFPQNF